MCSNLANLLIVLVAGSGQKSRIVKRRTNLGCDLRRPIDWTSNEERTKRVVVTLLHKLQFSGASLFGMQILDIYFESELKL